MQKFWLKYSSFIVFFLWLSSIISVGLWSIHYLPFTPSFPYYGDLAPIYSRGVAAFAHFDGIHYLRLIHHGYDDMGSQAFFPAYPVLIRFLTFGRLDPLVTAVVLNFSLLIASLSLVVASLPKLSRFKFLLLFLSFPTSFFLLANYTESFFIFLVVVFFLLCRSKRFFFAALIAGVASATRVVGVFLALALLVELIQAKKLYTFRSLILLMISISGFMSYCYYLFTRWGDPLMFVHVMSMFSVGRSTGQIILLPQLLYRYFKVLTTVPLLSFGFARALAELGFFALSLFALYKVWRKLPLSSWLFCFCAITFPSLSGTLTSFPRYLLVAIPLFVASSSLLSNKQVWLISCLQYAMLIISVALFVQGIFIA